jgi:protoporphyrinogen oxidase
MKCNEHSVNPNDPKIVIIGAGPAGLGCAYYLGKHGVASLVIERDDDTGGLCRTIDYSGYLFDIGGHRFLSKSKTINDLWYNMLGSELCSVQRISRIFYNKRYFNYPLSFFNTFNNLGFIESVKCITSYGSARFSRPGDDTTFEGWITNRFGKRLFDIFFDTYTNKVWNTPSKDISADWASQRIKGLSLRVALKNAIFRSNGSEPKTLSQEFLYPRKGPGQFFSRLQIEAQGLGAQFLLNSKAIELFSERGKVVTVSIQNKEGRITKIPVDHVFSSIPLPLLISAIKPDLPKHILKSASCLKFRSFLVVNVILDKKDLFPDQWIYIHSPEVRMGRIQNYKNWSGEMTPNPNNTSLGLEYFCQESDELWQMNDIDLINFAVNELQKIGLASRKHLISGFVVRRANVYPVYSLDYRDNRNHLQRFLQQYHNLQPIGRAGLFKYDNSDLAMLSGITAAKHYLGKKDQDLWSLGDDPNYLEA